MDDISKATLARLLETAGFGPAAIARAGGGVWCFGSRASGCASSTSDWDILVVTDTPVADHRARAGSLDIVWIGSQELDRWATTELAAHTVTYGVRIDDGDDIVLSADPKAAAPRKRAVVVDRAVCLERRMTALQPAQQRRATLRLRRDLHRAWLLDRGRPIPPTAILDSEWQHAAAHVRGEILVICPVPATVARAVRELDESHR